MYKEILNKNQLELLPFLSEFRKEFYMAGGTAIALHIGHRRSVDFDLFKFNSLNHNSVLKKIQNSHFDYSITRNVNEQINAMIHQVKFTFMQYPYKIQIDCSLENIIKLPDLLTLSAMKAFALGRRAKWKDYVDMFFILKFHFSINQIIQKASQVFNALFSEKLFRSQLCYFEDIDYTEQVEYVGSPISEEEIKNFLTEIAIDI